MTALLLWLAIAAIAAPLVGRWLRSRAERRAVSERLRDLASFEPVIDVRDRDRWPGFEDVVAVSVAEGLLDEDDPVAVRGWE